MESEQIPPDPLRIVRDGYDRVSLAYEAAYADEPRYRRLLEPILTAAPAGGRVLDIGCGCGVPAGRILAECFTVTGVDISPVQIERARQLVPSAEFSCADIAQADFTPGSFDAIAALWSIIHVPLEEQPGLLARIAAWLKPGGLLVATLGREAWTGTEDNWLGVPGATMYWSHADAPTYHRWLTEANFTILDQNFEPEPDLEGGHELFTAVRETDPH